MGKKIINFKSGVITLYDRNRDDKFGGSLLFRTEKKVMPASIGINIQPPQFLELIDFPLLLNFIFKLLRDCWKILSGWSKPILEKLFYSENRKFEKNNRQVKLGNFHLSFNTLAVVCLLISFLSITSILLPLAVAKINSISEQSMAQKIAEINRQQAEARAVLLKKYEIDPAKEQSVPKEFKLFIPKIGLDSDISPSVNLDSEEDYKKQLLTTGVAHAKGSYFPGQKGSVFLFAHSTDTVFNIARFNAKFFSLGELQTGDEIQITYLGKDYKYLVTGQRIIDPQQIDLIRDSGNDLILMTCTPPGTDWQRLIIFAQHQTS